MVNGRRFLLFTAFLFLSIVLQVRALELFGATFDFVLTSLIVFAFWDLIAEHILLIVFAVFLLNWRPGFAIELVFFAGFPLLTFLFRSYFPLRNGFAAAGGTALGIVGMYSIAVGNHVLALNSFLWKDVVGSIGYGLILFWIFRMLYHPKAKGFGSLYALPR